MHATIDQHIYKQLIDKHIIGVLLGKVFSIPFVQSGYKEEFSLE
jgi:hypothetical protein